MIDCGTATELMLTADITELRGETHSELSHHIDTCASCRARAELLLSEMTRLDDALSQATSVYLDAAPDRTRPARRAHRVRRVLTRIALPLAAAAALTAVVVQEVVRERGPLPPIVLPPVTVADVPVVNAPTGRNVAIMRTTNPNITVVWYY